MFRKLEAAAGPNTPSRSFTEFRLFWPMTLDAVALLALLLAAGPGASAGADAADDPTAAPGGGAGALIGSGARPFRT